MVHCVRESPQPPPPQYLGELINLLQSLLYLEAPSIASDPVHHSHHRLFDHLPADEALQDLCDLEPSLRIPRSKLLHLEPTHGRVKGTQTQSHFILNHTCKSGVFYFGGRGYLNASSEHKYFHLGCKLYLVSFLIHLHSFFLQLLPFS